jgi:nucleolar protein 56
MRAYIVTTFLGCFGLDEKNKLIAFKLFLKDPVRIAGKLKNSEVGVIEEEKQLMQELSRKGYEEFVFGKKKSGVENVEPENKAEKFVKENLRKIAIEKKFVKDQTEFNQLLTKVNLEFTKVEIKKAVGRDNIVIQTMGAIEELEKSINIFVQRLREFYGLHFPEMDRTIEDHVKFAKIVEKYGSRDKIEELDLKKLAERSMGADLTEQDIKIIQSFSGEILRLYELRENLAKYLEKVLMEVAPNFTDLAGPILSARLITKAGGLERLSKMPSSTIQLIGAEKSLFRFLHGKGKSPRFGILYYHPMVLNAPEKLKGKIARILSAKLSLAAKMDFYSKEYKGDKLKKELEEKVRKVLTEESQV